ncbi:MAG: MFS transporter [Candidatus Heimdallarchaeum aukensis]|uniref:MFS transporter n=1 Tax=Candidatus Heimdallarchaeum aukensis TaxID=2876573 RepID=A0A9Y1BMC3_9ARCH|nr:MAG: MFS transporter [Candidatus Heimdallarchaeum aukensis]
MSNEKKVTSLETEVEVESNTSWLNVFKWSMYDLANTIYSMVIVSLIINRYVLIVGQLENGLSYDKANAIFSGVVAAMQIIIAFSMPVMGAVSDSAGKRKPFVVGLTFAILLFASLLGFWHNLTLVLIFYVIANVSYQWSLAYYDAMLAFIAAPKDVGKVGAFGVAFGYFGTLLSLPVMIICEGIWGTPISQLPKVAEIASYKPPVQLQYGYYGVPWPFLIAMGMFLVFAIPFLFVKERQKKGEKPPTMQLIKQAFRQLKTTFKEIKTHREMFIFIIGYFLFVDAANVIVAYMFPIVRDGLLMSETFGMVFIVLSTISAVIFTYFVGMFADKKGAKNAFFLVGGLWIAAVIIGFVGIMLWSPVEIGANFPFIMIILMGVLAGPALGGTWVCQRAMIATLAPKEKFGEYFGFSKFSGKLSSAVGPLIWGATFLIFYRTWNYKTYALALLFIGLMLIIGLAIIALVKPERAARNY